MAARIEITHLQTGRRHVLAVPAASCWLCPAPTGIALVAEGAVGAGSGLHLVATRAGHRLEPAAGTAQVCVDGAWLYCKDLQPGDGFELAGHRLRWLAGDDGQTGVAAAPRGERRPAAAAGNRPPRRRQARSLVPVAVVFALALGGALFAFRVGARSDWPQTPPQQLELARTKFDSGDFDAALAAIDRALLQADAATAAAARALRSEIEQSIAAAAAARAVAAARDELEPLLGLRDRYLAPAPARPAAREVVRQARQWLLRHGAALAADRAGQALVRDVEGLVATWSPLAEPDTADTGPDVLFAAQAHLRFQVREYRLAIARLEEFLAAHPDDAAVAAAHTAMLAEGERWLAERVVQVVRTLERGDRAQAEAMARALERHAVLPQWTSLVEPLRSRLR